MVRQVVPVAAEDDDTRAHLVQPLNFTSRTHPSPVAAAE
jgi:hypothetical protein